jgi:cell division protein FtsB
MATRPRPKSAPGSDRAGRRPRTGSTAARRTSKVPGPPVTAGGGSSPSPSRPAPPPTARPASFTGRAAIVLLVLAVLAVSYASSARAWLQQRSDINALHGAIAQRKAAIASLQQAARRWQDPAYIEAEARLRFGWVMPGQIGYRVIDSHGHVLPGGGSSLSAPTAQSRPAARPWWQNAWGSVVEAGKNPAVHNPTKPVRKPALRIGGHPAATGGAAPGGGPGHNGTPAR